MLAYSLWWRGMGGDSTIDGSCAIDKLVGRQRQQLVVVDERSADRMGIIIVRESLSRSQASTR
jgi:hypothetical protein